MRSNPSPLRFVPAAGFAAALAFIALGALGLAGCGCVNEAHADPDPAQMVTGNGPIAETCQRQFADPVAQTACEVSIRMRLQDKTEERTELLERGVRDIFDIVARQDAQILELKTRLAALEDRGK